MFVLQCLLYTSYMFVNSSRLSQCASQGGQETPPTYCLPAGPRSEHAFLTVVCNLICLAFYCGLERCEGTMRECDGIKAERTMRADEKRAAIEFLPFSLILPAITYGGDEVTESRRDVWRETAARSVTKAASQTSAYPYAPCSHASCSFPLDHLLGF